MIKIAAQNALKTFKFNHTLYKSAFWPFKKKTPKPEPTPLIEIDPLSPHLKEDLAGYNLTIPKGGNLDYRLKYSPESEKLMETALMRVLEERLRNE